MSVNIKETIISLKDLSISYDFTEALENISIDIQKGDYIGLAGPNGAGKTTLIKAILKLIPISKGNIELFGKDLNYFNEWFKVGYLPQKITGINPLFPISVEEVVDLGLLSGKGLMKNINKADKIKTYQVLDSLNIGNLKSRLFSSLSGGQQQRVILARALVSEPEILCLDEPSTALDPESRESFFELINILNKEKGITIILITHDTGYIGKYANKLLYLDKSVVYYGSFKDFCKDEKMSKLFGNAEQHLICHQHE